MMVMQAGQVTLYGPRDQVFSVLSKAAGTTKQPQLANKRNSDPESISSQTTGQKQDMTKETGHVV
jgi:hypothetical protein